MYKKYYVFSLLFIGILSSLYGMKRSHHDDHQGQPRKVRRILNLEAPVTSSSQLIGIDQSNDSSQEGSFNQELINADFLLAVQKGDQDKLISSLLYSADINTKDECGMTALMYAAKEDHLACARLLLAKGAIPNDVDGMGMNAIDHAVSSGSIEMLKLLISYGVTFDNGDTDGSTPLFKAASQGKTVFVKFLLECGANPNTFTKKHYQTPLILATANNCIACICWLLFYDAKPDAENKWNKSACDIAHSPEAEKLLSDHCNSPIWKEFCRQRLAEKMGEKSSIYFLRNRELGKRIQK
jgi:ankyrin repeat protein